jgi:hypothetical protein
MWHRIVVGLVLTVGVTVTGCFLITGGTSGYTQAAAEGGCESAAECTKDGGAQICCLSATTGGSACQMGPCGTLEVQLCAKSAECDDVACIPQSCMLGVTELEIRACGSIPVYCAREN